LEQEPIETARQRGGAHAGEAVNAANNDVQRGSLVDSFTGTVVLKIMLPDVVHKFEAGGVILNVRGAAEAGLLTKASARTWKRQFELLPQAWCWLRSLLFLLCSLFQMAALFRV
jgi:hypothetical protein